MIYLWVDKFKSFKLKLLFWRKFELSFGFNKFICLYLSICLSYINVICSGAGFLFEFLQQSVTTLQLVAGLLSEVVANDSVYGSLRSVWFSEGEVLLGKGNGSGGIFKSRKSERDSGIVGLSEFVILFCSYLSVEDCPLV